MRYCTELSCRVKLYVVAHEANEQNPCEQGLLEGFEYCSCQRGVLASAVATFPESMTGTRAASADGIAGAAFWTRRSRPPFIGCLVVISNANGLSAPSRFAASCKSAKSPSSRALTRSANGFVRLDMAVSHPPRRPSNRDRRQTMDRMGAWANHCLAPPL